MTEIKADNLVELAKKMKELKLTPDEDKWQLDRYLDSKAREKGIPLHGLFELTPFCNLDCKMCYVHLNKDQVDASRLLSVDDWKQLIKIAHSMGMLNATLSGGECLSYYGFKELYLFLRSLGIQTGVLTNGVLLNSDMIDFFTQYPPKFIRVSLYGCTDEGYMHVTGHRSFSNVWNNIIAAKDAGLSIMIGITPNKDMLGEIKPILKMVSDAGIPFLINSNLFQARAETGRDVQNITAKEYIDIMKYQLELTHCSLKTPDVIELPDTNTEDRILRGIKCGAGRSSFAVKWDGTMIPCVNLDHISSKPLTDGFEKAWRDVNTAAKNYIIPCECENCDIKHKCLQCAALHKNSDRIGHCNPDVCERTKEYISAGVV